jgi:hypothetical protein
LGIDKEVRIHWLVCIYRGRGGTGGTGDAREARQDLLPSPFDGIGGRSLGWGPRSASPCI